MLLWAVQGMLAEASDRGGSRMKRWLPALLIAFSIASLSAEGSATSVEELWSIDLGKYTHSVAHGDVTGDGIDDIVLSLGTTGSSGAQFLVLENSGSELWSKQYPSEGPREVLVANLSEDARLDVVVSTATGRAVRAFTPTGIDLWSNVLSNYVDGVVAADLDGDGFDDVSAGTWGQTRAWDSEGTSLWTYSGPSHSGGPSSAGDLDGTGGQDLLVSSRALDGRLHALSGEGDVLWTFGSSGHSRYGSLVGLDTDAYDEVVGFQIPEGSTYTDEVFALDQDGATLWQEQIAARAVVCDELSEHLRIIAFTATSLNILDAETGEQLAAVPTLSEPAHQSAACVGRFPTVDGIGICSLDLDNVLRIRDSMGTLIAEIDFEGSIEYTLGTQVAFVQCADLTGDGFDEILVGASVFRVYGLTTADGDASPSGPTSRPTLEERLAERLGVSLDEILALIETYGEFNVKRAAMGALTFEQLLLALEGIAVEGLGPDGALVWAEGDSIRMEFLATTTTGTPVSIPTASASLIRETPDGRREIVGSYMFRRIGNSGKHKLEIAMDSLEPGTYTGYIESAMFAIEVSISFVID